jgi:hypothetical protein
MVRRTMFLWLAVGVGAALAFAAAAASLSPRLLRAGVEARHALIVAQVADGQSLGLVEIARSRRLVGTGFLPGAIVLRESIVASPNSTGVIRYKTHRRLLPGRYWVAVSVTDNAGVTSCLPVKLRGSCLAEWSNVLALTVR